MICLQIRYLVIHLTAILVIMAAILTEGSAQQGNGRIRVFRPKSKKSTPLQKLGNRKRKQKKSKKKPSPKKSKKRSEPPSTQRTKNRNKKESKNKSKSTVKNQCSKRNRPSGCSRRQCRKGTGKCTSDLRITRPPPEIRPPITQPPTTQTPTTRQPLTQAQTTGPPTTRPTIQTAITRPPTTRPATTQPPTTRTPTNQPPTAPPQSAGVIRVRRALEQFLKTDEDFIANWVQLVFHAAVGGQMDGCINTLTPDNKGLRETYISTIAMHQDFREDIPSFADFVALCGTVASEVGMRKSGSSELSGISIPFRTGRSSCPDPPNYRREFTFPHGDNPDSIGFLRQEFQVTVEEAIALMGAHSLGRCRPENSGFDGRWDNTVTVLDNAYYRSLLGTIWTAELIGESSQWNSRDSGRMMLHADVGMIKDITVAGSNKMPQECTISTLCPQLEGRQQIVERFAQTGREWASAYVSGLLKMIDH